MHFMMLIGNYFRYVLIWLVGRWIFIFSFFLFFVLRGGGGGGGWHFNIGNIAVKQRTAAKHNFDIWVIFKRSKKACSIQESKIRWAEKEKWILSSQIVKDSRHVIEHMIFSSNCLYFPDRWFYWNLQLPIYFYLNRYEPGFYGNKNVSMSG